MKNLIKSQQFWSMKSQINDIVKQKAFDMKFTFEPEENSLIITAKSEDTEYCGSLEANPLITFEKIKKFLLASNYQILSKSNQLIEISIGGLIDIELKAKEKLTIQSVKDTIEKLNTRMQNQILKNNQLKTVIETQQREIASITEHLFQVTQDIRTVRNTLVKETNEQMETRIAYATKEISQKAMEVVRNAKEELQKRIDKQENKPCESCQNNERQIIEAKNDIDEIKTQIDHLMSFNMVPNHDHIEDESPKHEISEPGLFSQSSIVFLPEQKTTLIGFFQAKKVQGTKLLYKASDNQFSVKKFHENCDGITNTLTLIQTEFDRKIGGFTPLKWCSSKSREYVGDDSKESFIFSLTYNDKFVLENKARAIQNYEKRGPIFGSQDLSVFGQANIFGESYADICKSYKNKNYEYNHDESLERFYGGTDGLNFKIKQWEVWKLDVSEKQ